MYALRLSSRTEWLDALLDVTDWMCACFVGFLEGRGLWPLAPISKPLYLHEPEALTMVENAALPAGSIAEGVQVGSCLDENLLRPSPRMRVLTELTKGREA